MKKLTAAKPAQRGASRVASPSPVPTRSPDLETAVREFGDKLFALMEDAGRPSLFNRKGIYGALMEWAMKDENFKVQLFRFIDVMPSLSTAADISSHLNEYLNDDRLNLPAAIRAAVKASGFVGGLLGGGIRSQLAGMARMFMLGSEDKDIVAALKRLHDQGVAFTAVPLGESVLSERDADQYAALCLKLLENLAETTRQWPAPCKSDVTPRGEGPRATISVKISALYSQIHPTDPETAIVRASERLRPILRRARELKASLHLDMEHYGLKNLTLRLFKSLLAESEFADGPSCGIALQAYLKDAEADARDLVSWARAHKRRVTLRLVRGAYWDYECIFARQKGWPIPVFETKPETDASFERLSLYLLENEDAVTAALGTHNVRSVAHLLAQAQRLGLDRRQFEFQVLFGMGDALKAALLKLDCRVREYCPVGDLLPGLAYFVRRLLENTSNEGFLAKQFAHGVNRDELLKSPTALMSEGKAARLVPEPARTLTVPEFRNEPWINFNDDTEREKVQAALRAVRSNMGRKHPLVINNRGVETADWAPSLNPANQKEIIGYSARASIANADAALAAARTAQAKWARTPVEERARLLNKLASLMRRDKANLIATMVLEAGKNWIEADADVAEAIDFCDYNAAEMRALGKPQRTQHLPGEENFLHWWPRGVGVIISPWNFPLAILAGMSTAAVATGNTVILKPSDQTTVIAARMVELVIEAGFPPGVFNILTGRGSIIGEHLISHPQIDFIAFTGSMEVGLHIWETAGKTLPGQANLKKVICEMGGKNCAIVDSDAALGEAIAGCVQSAFGFNGQKCSALSRLVVVQDVYDKVVDRMVAAASSLRIGPSEIPGNIIGPVIDKSAQRSILGYIEAGKQDSKLAWQGQVPDDPNACYVPPTIFSDVPRTARIFREEIFGPVLSITKAKDFDEALELANDCAFALTGGLFSRTPSHIERAKAEMVCGNFYINRGITGAIVGRQPFGGFKMSGGGTKAGGREYLHNFMVPRSISENCMRRGFAPPEEG